MSELVAPVTTPGAVLEALAVRHRAYAAPGPLLAFQAARLGWRGPARAQPWALTIDGVIVSTLLCYPFAFSIDGADVDGYALGSVATDPPHRGHGYARRLCDAVCATMERSGRPVGLLFSEIGPALYESVGFRAIDAAEGRCGRLADLAGSGASARLTPLDPRRDAERLCASWTELHRGTAHVRRSPTSFRESVDVGDDDWFLGVRGGDGGYVRLADDPRALEVVEMIVIDAADETPVLRGLARLALDLGREAIEGWLSRTGPVDEWFAPVARTKHVPMVRGDSSRDPWRLWASDYV
jgi:GNAT superfamily N-acetyltransferase